jgi:hypothetical protein
VVYETDRLWQRGLVIRSERQLACKTARPPEITRASAAQACNPHLRLERYATSAIAILTSATTVPNALT